MALNKPTRVDMSLNRTRNLVSVKTDKKLDEYKQWLRFILTSIYNMHPSHEGLSTLAKELTVATRSSNKLSTSVSDCVKYKQKSVNTYTLNSLACVGSAASCEVMLKLPAFDPRLKSLEWQTTLMSYDITKQFVCAWLYIDIYL